MIDYLTNRWDFILLAVGLLVLWLSSRKTKKRLSQKVVELKAFDTRREEQQAEMREWIPLGVILHGFEAGTKRYALIEMNSRTRSFRPCQESKRNLLSWDQVINKSFLPPFELGAPAWKKIDDSSVAMLGVVYSVTD
jgi:hypothetical protein